MTGRRISAWLTSIVLICVHQWVVTRISGFSIASTTKACNPSVERPYQAGSYLCLKSHNSGYLGDLIVEYGWGDRVISLSKDTLPMLAEIQRDGKTQVGIIRQLEFADAESEKLPKLIVDLNPGSASSDESSELAPLFDNVKVDIGQLTTIWTPERPLDDTINVFQQVSGSLVALDPIPLAKIDRCLDDLYDDARRSFWSSKRKGWTKKQLQQKIVQTPTTVSFAEKAQIESVLRQIVKAGPRHDQLVDSSDVAESLPSEARRTASQNLLMQRIRAATLLGESGGGRFKRLPCLPISWDAASGLVTVVNGGWVAVDSAVRAGSEARSLAETGTSRGTNADERIVQRLEYLAMSGSNNNESIQQEDLQMDVREFLKAMGLPFNPEGAREALLRMGMWSADSDPSNFKPQPWSPEILQAVNWYQMMDRKRKERLTRNLLEAQEQGASPTSSAAVGALEGRIDLTHLPCLCIDATRTSFRDDAIGIRSRVSTGRKVSKDSKWEILIHTADVSDVYSPTVAGRSEQLQLLQAAASKRGSSRYDLPSGPLHLLPPTLLETLSLTTMPPDDSDKCDGDTKFNRCVTLWVYIDASTGKLLDSGLERTLISRPIALSFQSASDLLQDNESARSPVMQKAKALLSVVERDVSLWSDHRRKRSTRANEREERLRAREQVDRLVYGESDSGRYTRSDDGRDGFRRTRGHRLVDTCLDLHGIALARLLQGAKASLPYVSGTQRDGRVASAPLRRYIDGMAQRQALSVLCGYGGEPLSKDECMQIGVEATKAINAISNIQSFKPTAAPKLRKPTTKLQKQQQAARALAHKLSSTNAGEPFLAMSTGIQSEVVILGVGAVASCRGIKGTLKPGAKVLVSIRHVDPLTGEVKATIVRHDSSSSE